MKNINFKAMKRQTISIGAIILLTSIAMAFTYKTNSDPVISGIKTCGSNEKSSSGMTERTQSEPDKNITGNTCSACHGGGTNLAEASITASPAFGEGNTYVPGTTYTITYQVTGYPKFGFDIEINDGNTKNSTTAGTFSVLTNCRLSISNDSPSNITHSSPISSSSTATFQWVAPKKETTVYIFSTGLGVDGTGGEHGDKEVFKNIVLTAETNSINSLSFEKGVNIYPNPAKDLSTIEYSLNSISDVSIFISDINGKIVMNKTHKQVATGTHKENLDVSQLNQGTYFVKIKTDNNLVTRKLVIN